VAHVAELVEGRVIAHGVGVRRYCAAVFAAGVVTLTALASTLNLGYIGRQPVAFGCLAAGVLLGEMLPVKVPRRGDEEDIVLSTPFSLALLLTGGLGPALLAQGSASVLQDLLAGKPGWRVRFNLGQYTLSLAAALGIIRVLAAAPHTGTARPFTGAELPAVLLGAAAFFVVNTSLVGIAVSRYQGVDTIRYFLNNAGFVIATGTVLLVLAPIVIAALAYSVFLVPLFVAPMLAIYRSGRDACRSEYAARHDPLTDLLNRTAFGDRVSAAIAADRTPSAVMLMDLDRFKEVNETLGHHYGDLLLQQVAERVGGQLGEDDVLARLGGDEFGIFTRRARDEALLSFARAIGESLRTPFELEQFVVDAQGSIGIGRYPDDGTDVQTLLQRADVAMYRAKEVHADVILYDERYDHHNPAKLALTAELRTAVQSDEIVVWFQPELDLCNNQVCAVEALVRWQHPHLGLLPPAAFIDMAEHTNLIKPLTQQVLRLALHQVSAWNAFGLDVAVAVNVSARVLVNRDFVAQVEQALIDASVPARHLKLEVTESTLMVDPKLALAVLQELSSMGIDLAIDDFGTGYSSLAYLADLPVAEVKIDRAFVTKMTTGAREASIVASTIDLAHHLGMRAVAEGVEDLTLLAQLRTLGCDIAQGYGISRPLDPQRATTWLLHSHDTDYARGPQASA